ncbi:MAG: WD40 repeat domain-containing protein [Treponemataceae bacterium]|nr:WD40 repeat domain-containing protein [Treponemataceae bacterium]
MKARLFCIFAWFLAVSSFAQEKVMLGKGEEITTIGLLNGATPVYVVRQLREGLISTIKKYYVVTGNEKAGPYDDVDDLTFSPDGKVLAYRVEIGGQWYVITGNEKAGPYDDVWGLAFSPDGKMLVYAVEVDGQWYMMDGKEKTGPYKYEDIGPLTFSPDGIALVYRAKINGTWYSKVLINGKEYTGSVSNGVTVYVDNNTIRILKSK